jgi:hypothetical protein
MFRNPFRVVYLVVLGFELSAFSIPPLKPHPILSYCSGKMSISWQASDISDLHPPTFAFRVAGIADEYHQPDLFLR